MQQHLDLALKSPSSQIEENRILAEIERVVEEIAPEVWRDDDAAEPDSGRKGRKRFSLTLFTALALVAVLVPAGLKKSDLLGKATHQSASD